MRVVSAASRRITRQHNSRILVGIARRRGTLTGSRDFFWDEDGLLSPGLLSRFLRVWYELPWTSLSRASKIWVPVKPRLSLAQNPGSSAGLRGDKVPLPWPFSRGDQLLDASSGYCAVKTLV